MHVGDIEICPVIDGSFRVPATALFPRTSEDDWAPHRAFLTDDGMIEMGLGGFLVRAGERLVLVDTGVGPVGGGNGRLLDSLRVLGADPGDVTDVVLTHLHFDHIGWTTLDGAPVFGNATYRCHAADWEFFCGPDPHDEGPMAAALGAVPAPERLGPAAEHLETWAGDGTLVPGLDVRSAPGHTPGSTVMVVSSGRARALLLGDVVHCPVELVDSDFEFIVDVDPELARRTREAWAREMEGEATIAAAAHFPGLAFGRLLAGEARRQWTFA